MRWRAASPAWIVVHLAARVGVGQSMYAIDDYADANERGTVVLLDGADRTLRCAA
jgi:dTDP-L-rhamnose 4-epimerase